VLDFELPAALLFQKLFPDLDSLKQLGKITVEIEGRDHYLSLSDVSPVPTYPALKETTLFNVNRYTKSKAPMSFGKSLRLSAYINFLICVD